MFPRAAVTVSHSGAIATWALQHFSYANRARATPDVLVRKGDATDLDWRMPLNGRTPTIYDQIDKTTRVGQPAGDTFAAREAQQNSRTLQRVVNGRTRNAHPGFARYYNDTSTICACACYDGSH